MEIKDLKKFIEKEFDSIDKDVRKERGYLIPWEEGHCDALDMIYKEMGFGKLRGNDINREGRCE